MGPDPIGWVSLQEEEIRTQTHTEGRPCEDTGRRRPSTWQAERPREEPALPTPGSQTPASRAGRHKCLMFKLLCATLSRPPQQRHTVNASNSTYVGILAVLSNMGTLCGCLSLNPSRFSTMKYPGPQCIRAGLSCSGHEWLVAAVWDGAGLELCSCPPSLFLRGVLSLTLKDALLVLSALLNTFPAPQLSPDGGGAAIVK